MIVEVALHQRVPGLLDNAKHRVAVHRGRVLQGQNFLGGGDRGGRALLERRRRSCALLGRGLLRHGGAAGQRQPERNARGRQDSCETDHSNSP